MNLFFKKIFLLPACFFLMGSFVYAGSTSKWEFYQLTIYQYTSSEQETVLNHYFKNALLPALHKYGYKNIGVFKSLSNDTAAVKKMYVFMPIKSLDDPLAISQKVNKDKVYQAAGFDYINAVYNNAAYLRIEVVILNAFSMAPQMILPRLKALKKDRVYELRSYESASEKIFLNKVQMFNEGGEINLFKRLNFNAVFYATVLAGTHMPNLMYMTSFENMKDRESHWKDFVDSPEWKKMSSMPEYQNNISHIDMMLLQPMEYSDF
jgi:NIPSNAP